MAKDIDAAPHPAMRVAVYLKEPRPFDLVSDVQLLATEREREIEDCALSRVGVNDVKLRVVVSHDQPLARSHRHHTRHKAAAAILQKILFLLTFQRWTHLGRVNINHDVLEPLAGANEKALVGKCLPAIILIFGDRNRRAAWGSS